MTNILLCGGSGTRLFPLSRSSFPKQFLKLFPSKDGQTKESLFIKTYERNAKICNHTIIVSNEALYFLAKKQISTPPPPQIKSIIS